VQGNYPHKIKYIQAYIHHMKHTQVLIRLPQSQREVLMMDQAYTIAKHTMKQMGKDIHV